MAERTAPRKQLPTGRHIIHYQYTTADGTPVGTVVSTPKGPQYYRATPEGWSGVAPVSPHPLYLLADLDRPGVVVVTSTERNADAVRRHWPDVAVTTWVGNRIGDSDWEPLRGREVSLIATADQPGHDDMAALADRLDGLGCRVKVMLPAFDADLNGIADWLATDSAAATERVRVGLRPHRVTDAEPDPVPDVFEQIREIGVEAEDSLAEDHSSELAANRYYRILGVGDSDGHVHVQYVQSGAFDSFRRSSMCEKKTLIALAPEMFWLRQTEGIFGPQQATQLGDSLIRAADRLGPFDMHTLLGRGAARMEDGVVLWHLGDRLLRPDGTTTETLEYGDNHFLSQPPISLTDPASDTVMREFAEAVMEYRWRAEDDGRRFLGWLVAALVGGALEHRPHIALIAAASSGKTWLLEQVVEPIFGPVAFFYSDVSAAGLSRQTGMSSMPVVVDEAEPEALNAILPTLRTASGGVGNRVRASVSGAGFDVQRNRFACLIVATAMPQVGAADSTRLSMVSFGPPHAEFGPIDTRIRAALRGSGPAIRSRIIRETAQIVAHADTVAARLRVTGADSRDANASAALTAGWCVWGVSEVVVPALAAASAARNDAAVALETVLQLTTMVPGVGERSLWRLLSGSKDSARLAADTFGVKQYERSGGLVLACGHSQLRRRLRGTRWQHHDLKSLLLQMPEIPKDRYQARIGGRVVDCLWIPPEALAAIGYSFAELARDPDEF